jgi:PIN domain nuclease of toxin-antitoxin system
MLCAKGRLALIKGPIGWYNDLIAMAGFEEAFLSPEIMVLSSFLDDNPPNDPGDRMIIATAKKYDATIITRDKKILAYAAAGNCKALEC